MITPHVITKTRETMILGMDVSNDYVGGEKVCCNFSVYSSNKFMRMIVPKKFKLLSYKLSLIQNDGIKDTRLISVHGIDGIGAETMARIDKELRLMIPIYGIFRSMYYFLKLDISVEVNGTKKKIFKYQRVRLNDSIILKEETSNVL